MEAGLDNANATNNLFTNSNGAEILPQKEGFLLNLTEGFKQNGAELSPSDEYVYDRPTNGKRPAEEFDEDEDMGPETDVDALDDVLSSPTSEQQMLDNKNLAAFDPFTTEIEEKFSFDMDLNLQKQQSLEFEPPRIPREETPTPPANEVHDAGVDENVADSGEDSEDEWNYFKGDSAESEKVASSKADQEVAELTRTVEEDEDEAMSQLNPNAAEFVPISSPTRGVVSPACRAIMNDEVIAQSPRKSTPVDIDINLPNPQDFEKEVKSRPSEVFSNGQDSENNQKLSSQEVMENFLNGKNIEDIEEFHPGGSPVKSSNPDEFHFGPNATPFSTPARLLDQSEAALSTNAVFGDESTASYLEGRTLGFESSFTDTPTTNPFTSEDVQDFQPQLHKPIDPMSTSYYQDENDANPFDDLNKVHILPVDVDELTDKPEPASFGNDTISDLPEHDPLGFNEPLVTDLDKPAESGDALRQLDNSNLLFGISTLPISPEPAFSSKTELEKKEDIYDLQSSKSPILIEASKAPLPITPEPISEEQDASFAPKTPDVVSPIPQDNIALDVNNSSPLPSESPLLQLIGDFGACDVKPSIETDLIVESNVENLEQKFIPSALPSEEIENLIKSQLPAEEIKSPVPAEMSFLTQDCASPTAVTPEPTHGEISQEALDSLNKFELTEDILCQSKSPEPLELHKSPVPTELSEDVSNVVTQADFFPIYSKPVEESKQNIIFEKLNVEETVQAKEDELLPIDSKLTASEAIPEALDIIESQLKTITPETIVEVQASSPTTIENVEIPSKSPEPIKENVESSPARTPEPTLNELQNLLKSEPENVCDENNITNVPKEEVADVPRSPQPVSEKLIISETEDFLQKPVESNIEKIEEPISRLPLSITPEISESPKEQLHNLEASEQLLVDEIQNILGTSEPVIQSECEANSPETIEESLDSEKRDLESPMEDVTSSVKDDNSITPEIIEEAKDISTEKGFLQDKPLGIPEPKFEILNTNYRQELSSAMQEAGEAFVAKEAVCEISSTPNTTIETESVNTVDVNSFLDRSNLLEITSPLSPSEQIEIPLLTEDIIKTELIAPQYPEETVITPSEETKVETPTVDEALAPAALPEVAPEAEAENKADETIVAAAIGAAATVAATTAVVAATKDKKATGKPLAKVTPTAKKSSKLSLTPSKATATKTTPSKITSKPAVSSPTKPMPTTTKTTKPPVTTKLAPISRTTLKPSPKPKTDVSQSSLLRATERKSLTNGDAKTLPKTSPATRKLPLTSTTTRSTVGAAKTSLAPKLSPTKTESKSSAPKTSTVSSRVTSTTARSTTAPKPAVTTTTTASSKPRPTTLSTRSVGTSSTTKATPAVSATKTTVQSKTSTTAISPRTTTAKPKPPTTLAPKPSTTTSTPKPRLSGSKLSSSKGPDTEKQMKDSVNKQLTASRTTTTTRTTGTLSTGKTTTAVKKTEAKSPSTRTTTTKTTITTIKPTKKPAEITRITAKKTTPTKAAIKSQDNGLTNGVTTIVQETTTILSTEPQLVKDLSPVENKLIIDNSQLTETNNAD